MTLFAGAFALRHGQTVSHALQEDILKQLRTDNGGEAYQSYDGKRAFVVKWDSGAFAEPAWQKSDDGTLRTLVGDPLLLERGQRITRGQQLERLATANGGVHDHDLAQCRGSFSLLSFSAREGRISLATDSLGLRSTFYLVQDEILIFASALRILEEMTTVRRSLSARGMAELVTFDLPLAKRTPYEEISVLRECEILSASSGGIEFRKYYDWTATQTTLRSPEEAAKFIYQTFRDSIRIRANNDRSTYSFLSGGMDSRSIVATLIDLGVRVEAMNFSPEGSQDQRFAQLFAKQAKDALRLHCAGRSSSPNFSLLANAVKTELERKTENLVDRRKFIWSGDGGSVGLGHVYMDEMMLDLADKDLLRDAMQHFLKFNSFLPSVRIMNSATARAYPKLVLEGVMEEVNRYPRKDRGRQIYFFLLFNDQRRHLFKHFESIQQHGLELLTPFYDKEFLRAVADTPVRWGILHRLYSEMFKLLPSFALETPWQTYPAHVPCGIATPDGEMLEYQWDKTKQREPQKFWERAQFSRAILFAFQRNIQPQPFSGSRVAFAAAIHLVGIRDCRHLLFFLQTYRDYFAKTTLGKTGKSWPSNVDTLG